MKKLVLAIFLILIMGCAREIETFPDEPIPIVEDVESFTLEFRDGGLFVINTGTAWVSKFTIDFETRWFESFELGPNDVGVNFSRSYEESIAPGAEKMITTLFDTLPDIRLENRAHHVYFVTATLKNTETEQEYQERYAYVAYQEGLNPWEDDAFIVGKDSYESIRQAITDYDTQNQNCS